MASFAVDGEMNTSALQKELIANLAEDHTYRYF
jgi:hypothetical protein